MSVYQLEQTTSKTRFASVQMRIGFHARGKADNRAAHTKSAACEVKLDWRLLERRTRTVKHLRTEESVERPCVNPGEQ